MRRRWIGVREAHGAEGRIDNTLVAVDLDASGPGHVLAQGHDFYASPKLSPDGARLAWLSWDHPNMPWVGTELWLAEIGADGALATPLLIAGGPEESIFQPQWSPDGVLYFVSDRTGWWNLYRVDPGAGSIRPLCPREAEFGQAQWNFGQSTYAFLSAEQLVCAYRAAGRSHLARLDIAAGKLVPIELPYTEFGAIRVAGGRVVCRAGSPADPPAIVAIDPANGAVEVLRQSAPAASEDALRRYFSVPQHLAFPTENGLTAYANYYPPANPDSRPAAGGKAAARRQMPWRPDRVGIDCPQPRDPVLDEPRHRRHRCRLRRQHRLWPGLSRAPQGRLGRRRCRRLRQRHPPRHRPGSRRWRARRHHRRQRRGLYRPGGARPAAMSSRAAPAITG